MDRQYKVKVWKDRMASVYPAKWCWEVVERVSSGKVIGCGTTFSEAKSREAAGRVVAMRRAELEERLAVRHRTQLAWPAPAALLTRAGSVLISNVATLTVGASGRSSRDGHPHRDTALHDRTGASS